MKSVLISIQPKWVEKIASGEKTIEVRKNKPNLATPFKCYIYCTKEKYKVDALHVFPNGRIEGWQLETANIFGEYCNERVIGEFICDRVDNYECELWNNEAYELIRQFNYDEYGEIEYEHGAENNENCEMLNKACLTWQDIRKYLGQGLNNCYAWHISDLKIYDNPKELSEFYIRCYSGCDKCKYRSWDYDLGGGKDLICIVSNKKPIIRPPQSWCYVESLGE